VAIPTTSTTARTKLVLAVVLVLNQLTQEASTRAGSYTNNFAYDSAGNPTTYKGVSHTFNTNNQNNVHTFDGAGNPTTYGGVSLTYDTEQRLTAVGSVLTVGYSADGIRAWKQNSTARTYFLYDGDIPVVEMNSSGTVTATNTFGAHGLLARRSGGSSTSSYSGGVNLYSYCRNNSVNRADPSGYYVEIISNENEEKRYHNIIRFSNGSGCVVAKDGKTYHTFGLYPSWVGADASEGEVSTGSIHYDDGGRLDSPQVVVHHTSDPAFETALCACINKSISENPLWALWFNDCGTWANDMWMCALSTVVGPPDSSYPWYAH
jgi:hypothetical protein